MNACCATGDKFSIVVVQEEINRQWTTPLVSVRMTLLLKLLIKKCVD